MSAIGSVIECYESGMEAMQNKQYSHAARYFLGCSLYYENGELPYFFSQVKEYGEDAMDKYYECEEKLSTEERIALEEKLSKYNRGGWRERASNIINTITEEQLEEALEEAKRELESVPQNESSDNPASLEKRIKELEENLKWIRERLNGTAQ